MENTLLENLLSTDNVIRRQTEEQIEIQRQSNPSGIATLFVTGMQSEKLEVASLSCILFKKYFLDDRSAENISMTDLEQMKSYFGYTLECGASWNRKINQNPKTIKAFVKNLQMSYEETEGACYERTSIELI